MHEVMFVSVAWFKIFGYFIIPVLIDLSRIYARRNVHVADLLSLMIDLHVKMCELGLLWLEEIYNMVRLVGFNAEFQYLVMVTLFHTLGVMCISDAFVVDFSPQRLNWSRLLSLTEVNRGDNDFCLQVNDHVYQGS